MVSCELILHESAILAEVDSNFFEFIVNRIRHSRLSPRSDPREIAPPPTVNALVDQLDGQVFSFLDGSEQLSPTAAQNRREN